MFNPRHVVAALAAEQSAAATTDLIQFAELKGHDPYVCFNCVQQRLPTLRAGETE